MQVDKQKPEYPIRFVTAASLFDGHDAAINIMRRILQSSGAEVIHLGHNRSVVDIVDTAIQEDVQGIAISSYQGGHVEYFKYLVDLLRERGASHIKVFGGGGGVIVAEEIRELHEYGVTRIFSPDDGMSMGLQGMIDFMMQQCDFQTPAPREISEGALRSSPLTIAQVLTSVERGVGVAIEKTAIATSGGQAEAPAIVRHAPSIGITGTGGAGKSTLTDELVRRFLNDFGDIRIAILSVDPTKRRTGGALLGDRIRMNAIYGGNNERVYMRSFATRQANKSISAALERSIDVCRFAGYDLIMVETAGIGQSDTEIADLADLSLYVMTQEFGAPTQLEKIGMLDVADFIALNKYEKRGSEDALRDIRKQTQRSRGEWDREPATMPVFPTMASHFNDPGVTNLYVAILDTLNERFGFDRRTRLYSDVDRNALPERSSLLPPDRQRYLGEIAQGCRRYDEYVEGQVSIARKWGEASGVLGQLNDWETEESAAVEQTVTRMKDHWAGRLDSRSRKILDDWDKTKRSYEREVFTYKVRGKDVSAPLTVESLSGTQVPRVAVPRFEDAGERLRFALKENLPGYFPYTAGVFPFKRASEDPTRMFAGEGSPERTNRRFHLVSAGLPAKRLSTAFDSVTLYGRDPHIRPDIHGKIGTSGVSICTLDDMKKLYSGFDLASPTTSVSMTINGPAPTILAMYLVTAIDQQVERFLKESGRWEAASKWIESNLGSERPKYRPFGPSGLEEPMPAGHDEFGLGMLGITGSELVKAGLLSAEEYATVRGKTLSAVRGTVQADILKEDQAQNTCIFSTEFSLRAMGDIQQYFVDHNVRNYYSVSISGYHIAEAGANPVSQLAFTLANGFTLVEYYLARGMNIDDFAPNLSFFFSNGLDPEYSVIGRVARRIWAVAIRDLYGGNERSQKLKYHIQTSGRSLHSREIQFNDIRTTLQALLAIYDNCNSLHTNAYDEAITTPTEESVRRAIAIQLIINKELGLAYNENPLQGSFVIEELTDLVQEAVLREFDRINDRGGVLGAMETMYQRGKIQEESLVYERRKHSGELPVVGINTFLSQNGTEPTDGDAPVALMRSSTDEKQHQLANLAAFHDRHSAESDATIDRLKQAARDGQNLFQHLLDAVGSCSLGQITDALFEVGGEYRRSM